MKYLFMSRKIIVPLNSELFSPHLEYSLQFWAQKFKKHIDNLECVQRKGTWIAKGLDTKPVSEPCE